MNLGLPTQRQPVGRFMGVIPSLPAGHQHFFVFFGTKKAGGSALGAAQGEVFLVCVFVCGFLFFASSIRVMCQAKLKEEHWDVLFCGTHGRECLLLIHI